jgi:DNA repair photolyase
MSLPLLPAPRPQGDPRSPKHDLRLPALIPLTAKTILQPSRGAGWPCARASWTINPYRGCRFGCVYCHARFRRDILEPADWQDFERRIQYKEGAAATLARELDRLGAKSGPIEGTSALSIAIGTVTDPYQPAEERLGVTRSILEVLAGPNAPPGLEVMLSTKSDLVLRDIDLLREIAHRGALRVNVTVTTLDFDLARALEPGAPSPRRRLRAVAGLRAAGIEAGVLLMPLIPGVNDREESIESLAAEAKAAGALYLIDGPLLLRPQASEPFFRFLRRERPALEKAYREAFDATARVPENYGARVRRRVALARRRHGLAAWPGEAPRPRRGPGAERLKPEEKVPRQLEIPGI